MATRASGLKTRQKLGLPSEGTAEIASEEMMPTIRALADWLLFELAYCFRQELASIAEA